MSQITCINKPVDMNLSLEEIEDQLASSTKNRNLKRPQCLLNKMTLTGKKWLLRVHLHSSWNVCSLLSKLTSKPFSGTQPKDIWFNLELDCSVQSDPNHNHQKEPEKKSGQNLTAMISSLCGANRWHSTEFIESALLYKHWKLTNIYSLHRHTRCGRGWL